MKKLSLLLLTAIVLVVSCKKKPVTEDPYLRIMQTSLQLPPTPGAETELTIESNMDWKLSVSPAATDWLQLDKTEGNGNATIKVKIIKDNDGTQARSAEILAAFANSPQQAIARITVEQKPYNVQVIGDKFLGGDLNDEASAIVATADGGCVIAGTVTSNYTGEVNRGYGNEDFWVVKLNGNRDTVWTKVLGGDQDDDAKAIAATSDGGYIVAGGTYSSETGLVRLNRGGRDFWVVKLNSNGDTVWTKTIGGAGNEGARSVTASPDGTCVIAGYTNSHMSYDVGANYGTNLGTIDYYIVKLNSNGSIAWTKTLGGTQSESAYGIVTATDGNYVIGGYTTSNKSGVVGASLGGLRAG